MTDERQRKIDEAFDRHFIEVVFSTSAFGGNRKVDGAEATINGRTIDPDMVTAVAAKLIPDDLLKPLMSARGRLYRVCKQYGIPGRAEGHVYVKTEGSELFLAKVDEVVAEYDAAADRIADSWGVIGPAVKEKWLPVLGGDEKEYQRVIGKWLPASAESLRGHYKITCRPVSADDCKHRRFGSDRIARFFRDAFEEDERFQEAHRRERYEAPIAELKAKLEALKERLASTKVKTSSVTSILDQLQVFSMVADVIAPDMAKPVAEIRDALSKAHEAAVTAYEAGGTYSTSIRRGRTALETMASSLIRECESALGEAEADRQVGRRARGLRLTKATA